MTSKNSYLDVLKLYEYKQDLIINFFLNFRFYPLLIHWKSDFVVLIFLQRATFGIHGHMNPLSTPKMTTSKEASLSFLCNSHVLQTPLSLLCQNEPLWAKDMKSLFLNCNICQKQRRYKMDHSMVSAFISSFYNRCIGIYF